MMGGRAMRFVYVAIAILAIILIGVGVAYRQAQTEEYGSVVDMRGKPEVSVVLTPKGFQPREIRITQGTSVTFTSTTGVAFWPASDPHPTHTDYPAFDPKEPVMASSSWSFVFDRVGSWGYHDHIHSYFTGTIYVDPQQ